MLTLSRHDELAFYRDDTAVVATSRSPSVLVNYLEVHLCRLDHCLQNWRICTDVFKSGATFSTTRDIQSSRPI
jgi:hypothetical protein